MQTDQQSALERKFINLASAGLGAVALTASDEFFGAKDRLLSDSAPIFIPGKYDDNGKWMDGWETRRRRDTGHDHIVIRLATPGIVHALCIDTSHFTGNYPHAASIDAANTMSIPNKDTVWTSISPPLPLEGDRQRVIEVQRPTAWTHVRLNIFPDGGVARLRVYGRPAEAPVPDAHGLVDLASALAGTRCIACNDAHYGSPSNLVLPGIAARMEDGWETRRRREPGNDWAIFALGHAGSVQRIVIDTTEYKGNNPDSASLQAAFLPGMADAAAVPASLFWRDLLPPQKLRPHQEHGFTREIAMTDPVTHVRFNIFPDGGINRLRLFGVLHLKGL